MNYKEFLEEVSELLYQNKNWDQYYCGPKSLDEKGLWCYWTTGGQTGGSCWDNGSHVYRPVEPEPEQDLEGIDEILTHFAPKMSFLEYRQIEKMVVYEDKECSWDYYGNWTSCRQKSLSMKTLFDFLCDKGYIQKGE